MLDAMDVLLYVFAIQTLKVEFGMSNAMAGLASSLTLVLSAVGGIASGILSDRLGRRRVMIWSILIYSLASGSPQLPAPSTNFCYGGRWWASGSERNGLPGRPS